MLSMYIIIFIIVVAKFRGMQYSCLQCSDIMDWIIYHWMSEMCPFRKIDTLFQFELSQFFSGEWKKSAVQIDYGPKRTYYDFIAVVKAVSIV